MLYLISFFIPNLAYADFNSFMVNVYREIFNPTIRLLVVVAFAYFFYGVFVFLSNMDSDEKKTTGKNHMIWGIVGLTVMLGVWGIMSILINTFDIKGINLNGGGGSTNTTTSLQSGSGGGAGLNPDLDSGDDNNYGIGSNPGSGISTQYLNNEVIVTPDDFELTDPNEIQVDTNFEGM